MPTDNELGDALDQLVGEGTAADPVATDTPAEGDIADQSTVTSDKAEVESKTETEATEAGSADLSATTSFRDKYTELTGRDVSAFQSDEALMASLGNLQGRIGERDEDAKLGQLLRGREDDVMAFLASQKKTATDDQIASPEYNALWRQQVMADPENVPADVKQKMLAFLAFREPFLDNFARDPKAALGEMVGEIVEEATGKSQEEIREETQARFIEQRTQAELDAFEVAQAPWMYVGGDLKANLTELGKEMFETFKQLNPAAFPSATARAERAMAIIKGNRQPTEHSPKVPDGIKRQPSNAGTEPALETTIELMKKGMTLDEILAKHHPEGQ